jgi:transcriptional regulator with PAS, ATPase and Fis domain
LAAIRAREQFHGLVGGCPQIRELCDLLGQVAKSPASVLITGETGTGKEVAAFAIHKDSERSSRPFVAINCAAIPEALFESDLFGHARGAFSGAQSPRKGLLLHAQGGSLFLDEIGDMPLGLQAKLLRVIETQKMRPVGSDLEVSLDVRFIAATHCDLKIAVHEGRFREDLFYRLNVIRIPLCQSSCLLSRNAAKTC